MSRRPGVQPDLVRASTVRLIDLVLESMADGRLDRVSLRKLPPWRAVVLARVAHRARLMSMDELTKLTSKVIEVGVDGVLDSPTEADLKVDTEEGPDVGEIEWTQAGMIREAVPRRQTGSRHPSR
jgi:hypothetical protein